MQTEAREILLGKNVEELKTLVLLHGLPAFTAIQIADWLYKKKVGDFQKMSNLSKTTREWLQTNFQAGTNPPEMVSVSTDGTKKYLFKTQSNFYIESAYIPEKSRATLCLSTQVGCRMGCRFCMTGKQGFQANLTVAEILNQYLSLPEKENVTNLVFMGMGEPFDNTENVMKSIDILTSEQGIGFSPKKITVSTVGVIEGVKYFLENSTCHLAISLHSPFEEERRNLMPIENAHPLSEIVALLKSYDLGRQRRISFEYIVFGGINDTPAHVKALVRLLNGLSCRINLIRFHSLPGIDLRPASEEKMLFFRDSLTSKGIFTSIRASRGQDIQAACGLLSTLEKLKYHH